MDTLFDDMELKNADSGTVKKKYVDCIHITKLIKNNFHL